MVVSPISGVFIFEQEAVWRKKHRQQRPKGDAHNVDMFLDGNAEERGGGVS